MELRREEERRREEEKGMTKEGEEEGKGKETRIGVKKGKKGKEGSFRRKIEKEECGFNCSSPIKIRGKVGLPFTHHPHMSFASPPFSPLGQNTHSQFILWKKKGRKLTTNP